jgi:preprotein translocase subunit SecA
MALALAAEHGVEVPQLSQPLAPRAAGGGGAGVGASAGAGANGAKALIKRPNAPDPDALVPIVKAAEQKVGRNDPCWCGSGKKFKFCHGAA